MPVSARLLLLLALGMAVESRAQSLKDFSELGRAAIERENHAKLAAATPLAPDVPGSNRRTLVQLRDPGGKLLKLVTEEVDPVKHLTHIKLVTAEKHGALEKTSIWENDRPIFYSEVFEGHDLRRSHVYLNADPKAETPAVVHDPTQRVHIYPGVFLRKEVSVDDENGTKTEIFVRPSRGKFKKTGETHEPVKIHR